MNFSIALF
jgi:hypothetical protein